MNTLDQDLLALHAALDQTPVGEYQQLQSLLITRNELIRVAVQQRDPGALERLKQLSTQSEALAIRLRAARLRLVEELDSASRAQRYLGVEPPASASFTVLT